MELANRFQEAQVRVKGLSKAPSTEDLLTLYAPYKQATAGDATGARPGMMDWKGRAKFDAWAKVKGTDSARAMQEYIAVVDRLTRA